MDPNFTFLLCRQMRIISRYSSCLPLLSINNRSALCLQDIDVGDICAGKYSSDNEWYRAEVIGIRAMSTETASPRQLQLKFIDYGNEEEVPFCPVSQNLLPRSLALVNTFIFCIWT